MNNASIKKEGRECKYDLTGEGNITTPDDYVYVERRVPKNLESEAHALIDILLLKNGYPNDY